MGSFGNYVTFLNYCNTKEYFSGPSRECTVLLIVWSCLANLSGGRLPSCETAVLLAGRLSSSIIVSIVSSEIRPHVFAVMERSECVRVVIGKLDFSACEWRWSVRAGFGVFHHPLPKFLKIMSGKNVRDSPRIIHRHRRSVVFW